MSALDRLLPRQANNDYRGHPIALYGLGVLSVVFLVRSLIHLLKDDSGVNSIATIVMFSGNPDPNNVIYMFSSLWGGQQLITVFVLGIVLLRYRNLVPLMYVLVIAEVFLRLTSGILHPLTDEFYLRTPPGKIGNLPGLGVSVVMLVLSLRTNRREGVEPAPARA